MVLQNSKNLQHLFLTPLYFETTVICEYSIDFHETFTDGLKLMECKHAKSYISS